MFLSFFLALAFANLMFCLLLRSLLLRRAKSTRKANLFSKGKYIDSSQSQALS